MDISFPSCRQMAALHQLRHIALTRTIVSAVYQYPLLPPTPLYSILTHNAYPANQAKKPANQSVANPMQRTHNTSLPPSTPPEPTPVKPTQSTTPQNNHNTPHNKRNSSNHNPKRNLVPPVSHTPSLTHTTPTHTTSTTSTVAANPTVRATH
jgi:hypothetical protein